MKVELDPETFNNPDCYNDLTQLLPLLEDGRHEWMYGELSDTILNSGWCRQLSISQRRTLSDLLALPGSPRKGILPPVYVTAAPKHGAAHHMTPGQAVQWLQQPLFLLVEDPQGGGKLLEYLLLYYKRKEVSGRLGKRAYEEFLKDWASSDRGPLGDGRLIRVENGSGGATANELERLLSSSKRRKPVPFVLVIVDSDKRYPDHRVSPDATSQKVQTVLARLNQECRSASRFGDWMEHFHELQKSEVENYLPEEALRTAGVETAFLNAWRQLPAEHQDFIDLKSGLRRSLSNTDDEQSSAARQQDSSTWKWRDEEERAFWQNAATSAPSQKLLSDLFQGQNKQLSKSFTRELSPNMVRKRDGKQELDRILQWILSAL